MALDLAKSPPPRLARAIVQRTRGRTHGPITRSDLQRIYQTARHDGWISTSRTSGLTSTIRTMRRSIPNT